MNVEAFIHYHTCMSTQQLCFIYSIAETFEGKNVDKFRDFTAIREIFSVNLGMPHPLCDQFNIPQEFSPCFLPICESFFPQKFPAIH